MELSAKTGYVNPRRTVQGAQGMASAAQDDTAIFAAASFTLFVAVCDTLGIDPSTAIARGRMILSDGDIAREASALREFIREEIKQ